MDWERILYPGNLSMLIPIIVLIGWILTRAMKHRERMAMIERGLNPNEIEKDDERS